MKYYLSSYKIGNDAAQNKLRQRLAPTAKRVAYIPNALDFATDETRRKESEQKDIKELDALGCKTTRIDLRDYFDDNAQLPDLLNDYDMLRVRGGNSFILRQAMYLSGFDSRLRSQAQKNTNLIYGGYSAGVCVLQPSLAGIELVDDPTVLPYTDTGIIHEGIGLIDRHFAPHYNSDHPESDDINNVVAYYEEHNLPYKTCPDGEVIIIEELAL